MGASAGVVRPGISTESGLSDLAPSSQATAREAYRRASASSEAWEAAADACVAPSVSIVTSSSDEAVGFGVGIGEAVG